MDRITISVTPSVKRRLEDLAHKDRRSVNILAGLIIEWWFQSQDAQKNTPAPKVEAPVAKVVPAPAKPRAFDDNPPPMTSVELGMVEVPVPAL